MTPAVSATEPPDPSTGQQPIELVGVDASGRTVVRSLLAHGEAPAVVLAAAGFAVVALRGAARTQGRGHVLTFTFEVVAPGGPAASTAIDPQTRAPREPLWDDGLVATPGEIPRRVQRVAAHAVVTSDRGILLTEFSDRTNSPGLWGLPGGGLDPGESPAEAVVREIWEETGQRVTSPALADLQSSHWIGRAPTGVLEDFHALRVLYRASCPEPVEAVVLDVGGTTSAARWVEPAAVADLPLTDTWRAALMGLLQ